LLSEREREREVKKMAFSNEYTSIEFLAEFDPGVAARNFGRGENNSQL